METTTKYLPTVPVNFLLAFLFVGLLLSCKEQKKNSISQNSSQNLEISNDEAYSAFPDEGNLVKVTTTEMDFQAPEEISSGWTTFRYHNKSPMTHFFILTKMPVIDGEQKTLEDGKREISPIFRDAMDLIMEGKREEGFAQFAKMPEWASKVVYTGGVGFLSPGETGQTDLFLEPGEYFLECYVKTGGVFHGDLGMYKEITVTEEKSSANPPMPTLEMDISSEAGFEMDEQIDPGMHVLAVNFKDQIPHEHGLGHDVHLVKLDEKSDLKELETWVNWAEPTGLETPAPSGTFLGGVEDMPAGNTAYMTVNITPGKYVWIAEVPNSSSKNMLKTFTVAKE